MVRKAATGVLLAFGFVIGTLGGGAPPAVAMSCQNTQTPASEQALEDFDASVFCLINEQRASSGRHPLRPNGRLRRAAFEYATSMEAGRFFSHHGDFFGHPVGATPVSRLRQVGYIRPRGSWAIGENLRWTAAEGSTPAATVAAWMGSPEHRKYLLKARFRDLGVAAVRGLPYDPSQTDGVTVVTEYGFRD
jgi:uncharacterized protein YkwD